MSRSNLAWHGARAALVAVALVLTAAPASAGEHGRVAIEPQATVKSDTVRFSDLGVLDGVASGFADLEVAPAPEPGETLRLSGHGLLGQLRDAGLDERTTVYTIPATVRVTRAFQEIPEVDLRMAVVRAVEEHLGEGESLESVEVPRSVRVAQGPFAIRVDEPTPASSGTRRRRVEVKVEQEGRVVAVVPAQVEVSAVGPVVVVRRPVERGALLTADDVEVEQRPLTSSADTALREVADAIGKRARVALATRRPVTLSMLASAPMVRKGDVVQLLIEAPGMRLSVAGEALESAGAGDRVRVVNPASKKEMTGQVVAHGTVVVLR